MKKRWCYVAEYKIDENKKNISIGKMEGELNG